MDPVYVLYVVCDVPLSGMSVPGQKCIKKKISINLLPLFAMGGRFRPPPPPCVFDLVSQNFAGPAFSYLKLRPFTDILTKFEVDIISRSGIMGKIPEIGRDFLYFPILFRNFTFLVIYFV